MSSITDVTIGGVTVPVHWEYTNGTVQANYLTWLSTIVQALQASSVDQNTANNVTQALRQLANLAKNGMSVNGTQSYLTVSMGRDLDALMKAFSQNGLPNFMTDPNATISLTQLQAWKDLAIQSPAVYNAIVSAQSSATTATRTLQSMIELEYVRTGNELLGETLTNLQNALQTTKNVLDVLSDLQRFHNQLQVVGTASLSTVFNFDFNVPGGYSSPTAWIGEYIKQASALFGKPIAPQLLSALMLVSGNSAYIRSQVQQLFALRDNLKTQMSAVWETTPASAQNSPNSLYGRLKSVYDDINKAFGSGTVASTASIQNLYSGLSKWMIDGYDAFNTISAPNGGKIQDNLTAAITAAQNLNDSQKEQVSRYLNVFEEFYKSASALLTAITQIIQKFATNISR